MKNPRHAALLVAFVGGVALACADRIADDDDELETEELPACLIIWGTGEWDDGTVRKLEAEHGGAPTVCTCMTEEEFFYLLIEDKQAFIEHELNAMALAECEQASARAEFDSDPCQEYYETGDWHPGLQLDYGAPEEPIWQNRDGLTCREGEGEELGCALGERRLAPIWLLALVGLVALRRRRSSLS